VRTTPRGSCWKNVHRLAETGQKNAAEIKAGKHWIGLADPCFVAAEIGINHNGDMALARGMIDAAVEAGATAVKFQNYRTEDFLSDRSLTYEYVSQGRTVVEPQFDMFKRCELNRDQLRLLKRHAEERNVEFFSTPTGEEGLEDLVAIGVPLLKNGSDYLGHLPLIRSMARSRIPTVLSTGMATLGEIEDAVSAFREAGGTELVVLHCVSAYPAPDGDVHLRKMATLAATFGCAIGFSDHTWGTLAAVSARAMGACFIEKHFTTDRGLPGPDQRFSSTPEELAELVRSVRRIDSMMGDSVVGPAASELKGREDYRLSCVAARDLPAGHVIAERDIAYRRPGNGLPPKLAGRLVGHELAVAVPKGHVLGQADLVA